MAARVIHVVSTIDLLLTFNSKTRKVRGRNRYFPGHSCLNEYVYPLCSDSNSDEICVVTDVGLDVGSTFWSHRRPHLTAQVAMYPRQRSVDGATKPWEIVMTSAISSDGSPKALRCLALGVHPICGLPFVRSSEDAIDEY